MEADALFRVLADQRDNSEIYDSLSAYAAAIYHVKRYKRDRSEQLVLAIQKFVAAQRKHGYFRLLVRKSSVTDRPLLYDKLETLSRRA